MLAFELEREVVGEMSAFVVSAKQPEGVGVPNLQRPKIEDALSVVSRNHWRSMALKLPLG